jgi:ribonuclease PH
MRIDGRRTDELRPLRLELGYTRYAEGSVLITQGQTVVLCNATVEDRLPPWMSRAAQPRASGEAGGNEVERGWVTAEYGMLPRSTHSRTSRETTPQARTQEIRRLIARSLRAGVDLNLLGRRQIIVDCDVLQADGGTRTASITGGYVALALALRKLISAGTVPARVMLAPVAAVSGGILGGEPLLDLCYEEDANAEVDFNIVMNGEGRFIELQGTAEAAPFDRVLLNRLLDLAAQGIGDLLQAQRAALEP